MAINKIKMRLQGHEKFAIREGWINKALIAVNEMPDAFVRKDATDIFGIGSNMVKSLRYWMRAFGLTNDSGNELTVLGETIRRYDPYLEDLTTLWLLHSNIAKNKENATTWYMYFNNCNADDLEKDQIVAIITREVKKYANGQAFSEKSLSNDVDVLLSMYSKSKEKTDPEDKNVSPFSQLGLIKKQDGKFAKNHPDKKTFSEWIVLYEISKLIGDRVSISIEEVINGENGLSKIYNLTNVVSNDLLDKLDTAGKIRVDRTAGLDMIYPIEQLVPDRVIQEYYEMH